jgi:hypothetical protein
MGAESLPHNFSEKASSSLVLGCAEDQRRGTLLDNSSFLHEKDPIGHVVREGHFVHRTICSEASPLRTPPAAGPHPVGFRSPPIRDTGSENAMPPQRDARMNIPAPTTSMRLASRLGTRALKSAICASRGVIPYGPKTALSSSTRAPCSVPFASIYPYGFSLAMLTRSAPVRRALAKTVPVPAAGTVQDVAQPPPTAEPSACARKTLLLAVLIAAFLGRATESDTAPASRLAV